MRRFRCPLVFALFAAVAAPAGAQPPVAFADAGLHAVQFIDDKEGWACGADGTVWHSMTGGKSWERQKTGTRASLRGLHFVSPNVGWAVGRIDGPNGTSVGALLRTTDSGVKWDEVGTNVMPPLSAVRFLDEKTGFVFGEATDAFPNSAFVTTDGGATWDPVKDARLPGTRTAEVVPTTKVILAGGAAGKLGLVGAFDKDGHAYRDAELDPLGGRAVNGLAVSTAVSATGQPVCYAACDGGAVLVSSDAGRTWGYANLGLSRAALACCDFRCAAAFAGHVWVAGRPGGFVLHSADGGKTWEVQKTALPVPANAIQFLDDKTGWLVGDFGAIQTTTDGGKTWTVVQSGGQRAAVLFLHARAASAPLDVMAALGAADGYLCAATALASEGNPLRFRHAVRQAGGATADSGWAFPLPAHAAGLPPRELLAHWDKTHDGKASEQLLRQAVLAVRMWQPEVVVCDAFAADARAADALALHAAKEAFKLAADPTAFPEQLETLNLKPWGAKKLYALGTDPKAAPVKIDLTAFSARLNDAPKDYAETAARTLAGERGAANGRCFVLLAHRVQGAEAHANLMDGCAALAPGGSARRAAGGTFTDPDAAKEKQRAVTARRSLEALAASTDNELASAEKLLGMLPAELKKMPDDVAARTAFALGSQMVQQGKWTEAREVFGELALRYPAHPLAVEAYRWLVRYHASTEARRRTEIAQRLALKGVAFEHAGGNLKPASGTATSVGGATTFEDVYRFHSADAILKWHGTCLAFEPKLSAFGPTYARDPAAWLCFHAARRHLGKFAEADAFVKEYFDHTPGAKNLEPGKDPWRDCLAAEQWLANRGAFDRAPKPLAVGKYAPARPLLDGKLDDAVWAGAKAVPLAGKDDAYKTEARFAYDDYYLYIAVTCSHPAGKRAEPVAKRTRDAELSGRDRIDITLDLDRDYQTAYRFQIDHRGALAEDCWGDRTWNPKYHVAFAAGDTEWTAELAIPLVELTGERPSHGKAWAANVTRITPGVGARAWSGPADGEARPEWMGLLQFRNEK
jgi:photosystem II stability/assembly factor-like uncharacterized protein